MARLQAYGFIDSFTNSLNPTIEGLQTKIKRWINAEVTSSQGPTDNMKCKSHAPFTARLGGRACSCARPAGVRVRKLPSPPARPAAVRMCVRPPGVRARAQAPARCPQGPLTSATLFAHLLPQPAAAAPLCGRGTGRRQRRGDGTRLAAACGGPARVRHRRLAPQADHIGVARPGSGIGPGPAVALPGSGIAVWRLRLTTPAAAAAASAARRRMASGPTGARRACACASSLHRPPARLLCACAWPGSWALARASARARGARTSAGASEAGGDGNGRANMTKRHCVHESKRPLRPGRRSGRHLRVARPGGGGHCSARERRIPSRWRILCSARAKDLLPVLSALRWRPGDPLRPHEGHGTISL
jgi:hypothetical protein